MVTAGNDGPMLCAGCVYWKAQEIKHLLDYGIKAIESLEKINNILFDALWQEPSQDQIDLIKEIQAAF